jgi:O-methyltransferase/aklanonic acid methyltransferase
MEPMWDRSARTYETVVPYFATMGARLVAQAGLAAGDHVLDVACGTGSSLVPAALAVGPSGRAVGVDYSPEMVAAARRATAEIPYAEVSLMDARELDFPDESFDVALCGMALLFVGLDRGLAEIVRVLRPAGRLVATGPGKPSAYFQIFDSLCEKYDLTPLPITPPFADLPTLIGLSGLPEVRVTQDRLQLSFADPDECWRWAWSHGHRWFLEQLSAEQLPAFKRELLGALPDLTIEQDFVIIEAGKRYSLA